MLCPTPKISVVIPVHQRASTIRRALDSVVAQNLPAHEIIVIDDGFDDATASIVRKYYSNALLLRQQNRGVSNARNTGIKRASGDWIALLDSDDEWLPDKLLEQATALQNNSSYSVCHCDEIWVRNGRRVNAMLKHRKSGGWIYPDCLPLCAMSPSAVLIKKTLFEQTGYFDESLPACEDYDLWLRICAQNPVLFVDEPLLRKFGGHEDQLSGKYWGMDRFRMQSLANMVRYGSLNKVQREMTLKVLREKLDIFTSGARKRSRFSQAEFMQRRYFDLLG